MESVFRGQGLTQGQDRLTARLARCGLPAVALDSLLSRHTLVRYPRGSVLFTKGSPADVFFAVLSGIAKIGTVTPGDGRILVALAGPGDLAGYADFSEDGERSQLFEAETLTNSVIALITRDHILRVMRGLEPEVILAVAENLNSMWSSVVYRYAQFLGMPLRERLEASFAEMAGRFGVPDARGIMLTPELGQEDLAEMIGGSRPMVSKLLIEMAQQKLIARQGRRYILLPHPKAPWKMPPASPEPARGSEPMQRNGAASIAERAHPHPGSGSPPVARWLAVRAESRRR
jgi:CRP/FNR family cyclic AMP-dependent transcriptional regulator